MRCIEVVYMNDWMDKNESVWALNAVNEFVYTVVGHECIYNSKIDGF